MDAAPHAHIMRAIRKSVPSDILFDSCDRKKADGLSGKRAADKMMTSLLAVRIVLLVEFSQQKTKEKSEAR